MSKRKSKSKKLHQQKAQQKSQRRKSARNQLQDLPSLPKGRLPQPNDFPHDTQESCNQAELLPITYDPYLLERARTQWQFGDWDSLASLMNLELEHHPDRAKLALLAASGLIQKSDMAAGRQQVRLAREWGCPEKLIKQVLVSGVHNSLARASAAAGQMSRAQLQFENAIGTGMPGSDISLLTQARADQQNEAMALPPTRLTLRGTASKRTMLQAPTGSYGNDTKLQVSILNEIKLGDAWAGNTINTVIFRHHGLLTANGFQYTAFYVDQKTLRFVKRTLADNTLEIHDLPGEYNLRDAHNSINLGIDRQGHIHVSYDHHAARLRYRRGLSPYSIDAWSEEIPMTGSNEDRASYPTFIVPHHDYPLTMLYRNGTSERGTAYLKTYDETTQQWCDHDKPILTGADQAPWTSNAYWNSPVVGKDGSLHLSFVWRTHSLGDEKRVNNINIGYAKSYDNGKSWVTSKNMPYQLPITQVNAETICSVSPGSNLINQCGMALDSQNRPHIVFYSDDENGVLQYQHLWFNGNKWCHQYVSTRKSIFNLCGAQTLRIPISRPEIILDKNDNAYVIYRGDISKDSMAVVQLRPPTYLYVPESQFIIYKKQLGFAEPVIDRELWKEKQILSMLCQFNDQPDHDKKHENLSSTVSIVDIEF